MGVCQTAARQLPDSCQTAARQLGAIQIWSAECGTAFWHDINKICRLFLDQIQLPVAGTILLETVYAQPTHATGNSPVENRGKVLMIHEIRRTQRSFQRRPLRAPTSCVPSTCALGCGDRRSGNKTRSQALRLSGSAGCKSDACGTELVPSIDDQSRARTLQLTSLPSKVMSQSRGRGFGQYDSSRLHVRAGPSMDQPAGEAFQRFDPFNFEIFDSIRAAPTTLRPGSFGAVIKLFLWLACSG